MNSLKHESDAYTWAYKNFGDTQLFDKRRTQRLVHIATKLATHPGQSLASLYPTGWYDTKAVYNLMRLDIMTPDAIQKNHRVLTNENIENWDGDVLLIEDGSELEWNGHEPIEGLAPVGSGRKNDQGFILHSTLAVGIVKSNSLEISKKILGLFHQQYYTRPPKRKKRHKRSAGDNDLETNLWFGALKNKTTQTKKKRVIRVCDRNADIYEHFQDSLDAGYDFIIRAKHDRLDNEDWEISLFKILRDLPPIGATTLEKRGKKGTPNRTISLNINWQEVSLRAPARPGYGLGTLPPLNVSVVHVWGHDPEDGSIIEWFLYTSLTINDFETACLVTKYYAFRWIIEDYHKALKSGLNAEDLQLKTAHGLFAAISIMSIIALRLVDIREVLRISPDAPAEESGLSQLEIKVLKAYLKRDIKTVKCVGLAIGRLGGHLNRKSDGMPGIKTLWLGMSKLKNLIEGINLNVN